MTSRAFNAIPYPPAPWLLRGHAIVGFRSVSTTEIRHHVPSAVRVQMISPGRTLSVVALIRYGARSTLEYNELIIAPTLVRVGGRIGALITHIYVDSPASLEAGRQIWGLPKQLAAFDWREGHISVRAQNLDVQFHEKTTSHAGVGWRLPVFAPAFGAHSSTLEWMVARGSGRISRAKGRIACRAPDIEALEPEKISRFFRLTNFSLSFPVPRSIPTST
jgi:acetoacetate decarboxylase